MKPTRNDQLVPRSAKVLDSVSLLSLEDRAADLGLSQRLPRSWLDSHLATNGKHYLWPALWHRLSHRPEISPHLRCHLLVELRDGERVLSLLDVIPQDYEPLAPVPTRSEFLWMARQMDQVRSVREHDEGSERP